MQSKLKDCSLKVSLHLYAVKGCKTLVAFAKKSSMKQ